MELVYEQNSEKNIIIYIYRERERERNKFKSHRYFNDSAVIRYKESHPIMSDIPPERESVFAPRRERGEEGRKYIAGVFCKIQNYS